MPRACAASPRDLGHRPQAARKRIIPIVGDVLIPPSGIRTMKTNVGNIDRALRVIVGIALLSLLFILEGNARWFGLIGIVPLFTAVVRFCPLYAVLGMDTCPASIKGA
jgi:hypothetical protein